MINKRQRVPCRHYAQGRCTKGKSCPFAHIDRRDPAQRTNSAMATVLRLVFEKQDGILYENDRRVLNLSNLAGCPDLHRVATSVDFESMAFCDSLVEVMRATCADVFAISLDNNKLRSLYHFLKALERGDMHQGIRAISAKGNDVSSFEFIDQLKHFPNLNEVSLAGNPIADHTQYRATLRKGLPSLQGIDGEGVVRPPLVLPWAAHLNHEDSKAAMLQHVERTVFRCTEGRDGSVDALTSMYSDDAIFTFTCEEDALVKAPTIGADVARRSAIVRDYVTLRMAQTDRNNNAKAVRKPRSALGLTDCLSALRATLYPRHFDVEHNLSPESDVVSIDTGVKEPLHAFTFHGTMRWVHVEQPGGYPGVSRTFDRTLILAQRPDGSVYVTNDLFQLRMDEGEVLWFADSNDSVLRMAEKYNIPVEIMRAAAQTCTSDMELQTCVQELQSLPLPVLTDECMAAAQGVPHNAVLCARVIARCGCTPTDAASRLEAASWGLAAACEL